MRTVGKIAKWVGILLILLVAGAGLWLWIAPPALIRVATGYTAKIVCSNVFIAERDPSDVLEVDVQAPGHPLLRLVRIDVDRAAGTVGASLLGLFGNGLAVARPGTGCAKVPDGDVVEARGFGATPPPTAGADKTNSAEPWPRGETVEAGDAAVAQLLADPAMTGPAMRGIVVVRDGRIVGEAYGPGFGASTPLLGWSMTKTVTAALVGTVVADGKLSTDRETLLPEWTDERARIALADLSSMSSGLQFNEDYGDVTDVTRMLSLEPDMAAFAAAKPLEAGIGERFNYSSGTSVLLSRVWQEAVGDRATALAWPREKLFAPLGMTSAVLETDASGTFVGSSYLYATARDWARFGQFLLDDGVWNGTRLLPEGYVGWMREPAPASSGSYGRGQLWLHGPGATPEGGTNPDSGFSLPEDAFWLLGHDGQSMVVVPSLRLVVVRLGLTPSGLGYKPQKLVEALAKLPQP